MNTKLQFLSKIKLKQQIWSWKNLSFLSGKCVGKLYEVKHKQMLHLIISNMLSKHKAEDSGCEFDGWVCAPVCLTEMLFLCLFKHRTLLLIYFTVLFQATQEELKAAYRRLCMLYHPDKHRDPELKRQAEQLFNLVHEAYEGWASFACLHLLIIAQSLFLFNIVDVYSWFF